jgi:hypothetical protein
MRNDDTTRYVGRPGGLTGVVEEMPRFGRRIEVVTRSAPSVITAATGGVRVMRAILED